ncbi:hypothetical protein SAMN05216174_1172 [Actinokineospora iranica]|uniref:Uncharacterized protein n=1 Tax=Actinokineospora iranica TaxID=1271860 RepID=A0A1G6XAG9_9PSEU|nr:hypothetical protein SAMN05216174_1172 [Actinokineospora iranica]
MVCLARLAMGWSVVRLVRLAARDRGVLPLPRLVVRERSVVRIARWAAVDWRVLRLPGLVVKEWGVVCLARLAMGRSVACLGRLVGMVWNGPRTPRSTMKGWRILRPARLFPREGGLPRLPPCSRRGRLVPRPLVPTMSRRPPLGLLVPTLP